LPIIKVDRPCTFPLRHSLTTPPSHARQPCPRPGSPPRRAYGAIGLEFFSPGIPQICQNAGAEFILYDMEHTGLSFETLKMQVALCRGLDIVPMVRVPRGEYHFIARALDVGVLGVMVPMVAAPRKPRTSRPARAIRSGSAR